MIKLFCFPYAGGSATIYNSWKKTLDPSIKLHPVELKGRGTRYSETLYSSIDEVISDIIGNHLEEFRNSKFSFWGHSMGGLLAYEISIKLRDKYGLIPEHIFMSGANPPDCRNEALHNLSENEFIKALIKMDGTPKEVFENETYRKIFLPIILSDYRMLDDYKFQHSNPVLNSDISVLIGKDDNFIEKDVNKWNKFVNNEVKRYYFEGGHFYLNDNSYEIISVINNTLSKYYCR